MLASVFHKYTNTDFMDFLDGYDDEMTAGLKDATQAQNLVEALRKQNFSEEEIEMICYKNTYNFLMNNL